MNTYLGPKGYTLFKSELTADQQKRIRQDLTVRPFTPGAPSNDMNTFPVYRESPNRIYVPHYYGMNMFGAPKQIKLSEGHDIQLTFCGVLRDYQAPVVEKFIDHCARERGGLLELHTAWGKTSASLCIAARLGKKTLVIVHKEFLMNQWIERIQQFLPDAKVGKIQGPVIDVDGKDIVLCMLQSLVQKEYPATLFEPFGLTIIDEVHHISSQSFSNSLFKVVTKYMLGLSATMDRKDGTTAVFKMFLGDVVHKAERKTDIDVEVRAVTYKVDDEQFNETILDYRGKPQNSSMISKLCEYSRRTEFIIQTLCDFIAVPGVDKAVADAHKAEMDSQIPPCGMCQKSINYLVKNTCCDCVQYCLLCMDKVVEEASASTTTTKKRPKCPNCLKVLKYEQHYVENPYVKPLEQTHTIVMAHNLNILNYMYKKFVCKNLASVGYYVGGMKEAELKRSEKKQVILSTYIMVSEGLDIPSLNAEFLISPKTDIVQTVGRVLRAKHAFSHPIIYDFVDSHDVFQRQWARRRAYYKKQNYKIVGCSNKTFGQWKTLFQPSFDKGKTPGLIDSSSEEEVVDSGSDVGEEVCLLKV